MSGGGKGGSTTTRVEIPQYIEDASRANLARADEIAKLGYVPYYGPEVAAFSPMQNATFQNTADAASAFGMAAPMDTTGMPAPQVFAGGIQGYSSGSLYDQALAELRARRPGQFNAISGMFVDPVTGAAPRNRSFRGDILGGGAGGSSGSSPRSASDLARMLAAEGGGRDDNYSPAVGPRSGGFTSIRDMFDGGGPGRSGGAFSGGGRISDVANAATGRSSGDRSKGGRK